MPVQLDILRIQELLPHRYPFLLVDKVVECDLGVRLVAIKNVTYNEAYFQGHFPQKPVMPGVLIIEAMAQTAGMLGFESAGGRPKDVVCYLVGIDKAKFKRPVVPGDQLKLEAHLLKNKRNLWLFECQASVDGEFVASAAIRYATVLSNEK